MPDVKPLPRWFRAGNHAVRAMSRIGLTMGPICVLTVPGRRTGKPRSTPAVMPDPAAPRSQRPGGRGRLQYADVCWPPLAAGTSSHYSEPRHHLSDYASPAAADINSRPSGALQSCPAQ